MQFLKFVFGSVALVSTACAQATSYCDPATTICYQSYTNSQGVSVRIAIPSVTKAPFDLIFQIVAPISQKWVGFAFGGRMQYNPLIVAWPNGASVVGSSRWATGYSPPSPYSSAVLTTLKGTGATSTQWTLTVRCVGCSTWEGTDGNTQSLNPQGVQGFAWAQSMYGPSEPANSNSVFSRHDSTGSFTMDLTAARSNQFSAWVANNLQSGPSSSAVTSKPVPTTTRTTLVTSASPGTSAPAIPISCPGVSGPKYPGTVAAGWRATKIAGEVGKGVTQHTIGNDGCIASSRTIIAQTNLNHGIVLTPDGKTLYASSMTTVWRWSYDTATGNVGSSTVVITGMSVGGHATRTLVIPKNKPNLLVVSCGSNSNLDMPTVNIATARAVVKVFDLSKLPGGGYSYNTAGWNAGYGLRNEVALAFDPNNNLWGAENSADDLKRIANGQTTDVHVDNPAEEVHYLGDVSVPNNKWYGYPVCFTVWQPSVFPDKVFQVGDQFMVQPNSSFNDATCAQRSTPARLALQAHSAPLDAEFDNAGQNLYVSFHGSWNRPSPTGFKLVTIPFRKGSNGAWEPVAPLTSRGGYNDIWWNTDSSKCSGTSCFRPVGIAIDNGGRLFVGSDAPGEGEIFILGPASGVISSTGRPSTTTPRASTTPMTTPIKTTTSATLRTTTATSVGGGGAYQIKYGQCGGQGYTGLKNCAPPSTCQYSNDFYSQCL